MTATLPEEKKLLRTRVGGIFLCVITFEINLICARKWLLGGGNVIGSKDLRFESVEFVRKDLLS